MSVTTMEHSEEEILDASRVLAKHFDAFVQEMIGKKACPRCIHKAILVFCSGFLEGAKLPDEPIEENKPT